MRSSQKSLDILRYSLEFTISIISTQLVFLRFDFVNNYFHFILASPTIQLYKQFLLYYCILSVYPSPDCTLQFPMTTQSKNSQITKQSTANFRPLSLSAISELIWRLYFNSQCAIDKAELIVTMAVHRLRYTHVQRERKVT